MLDDRSMTNAALVIITLISAGIVKSFLRERLPGFKRAVVGAPVRLIENGMIRPERLAEARIGVDEIMVAARQGHGLEQIAEVKHAILEAGGGISIVPHRR